MLDSGNIKGSNAPNGTSPPSEVVGEISLRRRFLRLRTLISFVLALAFLGFIFIRLDVDFAATWQKMRASNPLFYVLAFVSYYLSFPPRGWRWKLLLHNAGLRQNLPSSRGLAQIILLSWFANCILYARLGDVYRAYLLKEEARASFSKVMGTVLAERLIDVVVVFLLLVFAGLGLWGGLTRGTASAVLIAGFIMVIILALVVAAMWRFGPLLERHLPPRLSSVYVLFHEGALGSFRQLPLLALVSLLIWLLEAGRLLFVTQALGFSLGWLLILFAALTHALLSALPFTPGGLGFVEAGVAGLFMLVLTPEDAWSIALVDRTISYLSIIFFGLLVFLYRQIRQPA